MQYTCPSCDQPTQFMGTYQNTVLHDKEPRMHDVHVCFACSLEINQTTTVVTEAGPAKEKPVLTPAQESLMYITVKAEGCCPECSEDLVRYNDAVVASTPPEHKETFKTLRVCPTCYIGVVTMPLEQTQ